MQAMTANMSRPARINARAKEYSQSQGRRDRVNKVMRSNAGRPEPQHQSGQGTLALPKAGQH